jgi:hypothetical protein
VFVRKLLIILAVIVLIAALSFTSHDFAASKSGERVVSVEIGSQTYRIPKSYFHPLFIPEGRAIQSDQLLLVALLPDVVAMEKPERDYYSEVNGYLTGTIFVGEYVEGDSQEKFLERLTKGTISVYDLTLSQNKLFGFDHYVHKDPRRRAGSELLTKKRFREFTRIPNLHPIGEELHGAMPGLHTTK